MLKKYLPSLLKEWLPLIAISFFLVITPAFITSATHSFYEILRYENYKSVGLGMGISLLSVVISSTLLAALFALFVESYRFKRIKTDFYYSLPFKPRELRRIRTLAALTIVLIIFTLSYWVPSALYYLRYGLAEAPINTNPDFSVVKERMLDPLWLLYGYLSSLILLSSSFFFCSFFVRLGNSITSSVLLLLGGSITFGAFFPVIALWVSLPLNARVGGSQIDLVPLAFQMYGASAPGFSYAAFFLEPLLYGKDLSAGSAHTEIVKNPAYLTCFIISLLVSVGLGAFGAYTLFWKEDPSGEWSGQPGSHKKWSKIFLFMALATVALMTSLVGRAGSGTISALTFGIYFVLAIFFAAIQYVVYLLYEKKAALSKTSWIFFGIAQGISLLFFFVQASLC